MARWRVGILTLAFLEIGMLLFLGTGSMKLESGFFVEVGERGVVGGAKREVVVYLKIIFWWGDT